MTRTLPNHGIDIPEPGDTDWGTTLNTAFEDIDQLLLPEIAELGCGSASDTLVEAEPNRLIFGSGLIASDDPAGDDIDADDKDVFIGNAVSPTNVGSGIGEVAQGRTCEFHTFRTLRNIGSGADPIEGLGPGSTSPFNTVDFRTFIGGPCIDVNELAEEILIEWVCPFWVPWERDDDFVKPTKQNEQVEGIVTTRCLSHETVLKGTERFPFPLQIVDSNENQQAWINDNGDIWTSGNLEVKGDKKFIEPVHTDDGPKEVAYRATEAGTARTETSGVGRLDDGRAEIDLPDHFAWVTSEDEPLVVQTTPYGGSAGLKVVERSPETLIVEDLDNEGEYEFAYTVKGTRAGYEDEPTVRELQEINSRASSSVQDSTREAAN